MGGHSLPEMHLKPGAGSKQIPGTRPVQSHCSDAQFGTLLSWLPCEVTFSMKLKFEIGSFRPKPVTWEMCPGLSRRQRTQGLVLLGEHAQCGRKWGCASGSPSPLSSHTAAFCEENPSPSQKRSVLMCMSYLWGRPYFRRARLHIKLFASHLYHPEVVGVNIS